jgi:hypothetical protein
MLSLFKSTARICNVMMGQSDYFVSSCSMSCNKLPFSAIHHYLSPYFVCFAEWLDLMCRTPGVWAWGQKIQFQDDGNWRNLIVIFQKVPKAKVSIHVIHEGFCLGQNVQWRYISWAINLVPPGYHFIGIPVGQLMNT